MTSVSALASLPASAGTGYGFRDVTDAAGLAHARTGTWGSSWNDHDGDGWADLFIGRHGVQPLFYRGSNGTYERVRYDFVDPPGYDAGDGDTWVDRHTCAWGEATGDGTPDLYCTVGANVGTSVGPNQLLVRTPTGIRDVARAYRVRDRYGRGRSVNWLDFDTDGDLDLFLGNWQRDGHASAMFENTRGEFRRVTVGVEDKLRTISSSWSDWDRDGDPDLLVMQYTAPTIAYENRGGRYVRVDLPFVTSANWHSASWGDFNADGWTDLHVVNDTRSLILKNERGRFSVEDSRSVREGRMGAWLDVENDGDQDLFLVQGAPGITPSAEALNHRDFLLVRRAGRFEPVRRESFRGPTGGNGDGATVSDHDHDGRQDLLVTNGYFEYEQWVGRTVLLENRIDAASWVAVQLLGKRWNPMGIGARVRVESAGKVLLREITDGVSFRGQSEVSRVHLGLGRGSVEPVLVRVKWPGGSTDCAAGLRGQTIAVAQDSQPC
ncbi:MAG: VCBS repeat-containing protein [Actinomycetota bacterium]|nr:VCBS repeat-containing protein [Actinomycetota bacterium]